VKVSRGLSRPPQPLVGGLRMSTGHLMGRLYVGQAADRALSKSVSIVWLV
jgi:hypothetical protein